MNALAPASSPCLAAALECAARGWHVFPVPPGTKRSHKAAPHSGGRRWGATTDPDEIRRDWRRWPDANVGITTGPESGLLVIDCDTSEGHGIDGVSSFRAVIAEHGGLPDTIEAVSPSGSWHIYFAWPAGEAIRNSAGVLAPGVDVRGEGGMVLAPPSVKPGRDAPYRWRNPPGFFGAAECPAWLLDRLRRPAPAPVPRLTVRDTGGGEWADAALRGELARLLAAPEGARNHALNRAAHSLGQVVAGGGLPEGLVRDRLAAAATAIGLDPGEAVATVASGLRAGLAQPRGPKEAPVARQSPPPPETRASRFFPVAELEGKPVPAREWLVPDLIPGRNVTLLGGDGGTGKSLLALQLAVAVAGQRAWIGRAVTPGPVLVLSAEDDADELHRRLADIVRAEGLRFTDLSRLLIRSLAGEDALLAIETAVALTQTALFEDLAALAEAEKPRLIVLDTLADLYPANENDRAKVRQFISILRGLAIRANCAVLLLGHPSLTGLASGSGTSGSTAWNNSVRSRLYLERIADDGYEPEPDNRRLTTKKANYGRVGGEILLRWRDGVFVADAQPATLDAMALGAKAERVFVKLLRQFAAEGRRVCHGGGINYAPRVFAEHPDREGLGKKPLAAAMHALLARGVIAVHEEGPPSRRVSHLREVAP